jgi:hypothetical protein
MNSTSSVPLVPHLRGTPAHTPLPTPGPAPGPSSNPLATAPTTAKSAANESPATHATPAIFDDKISADVFGSRRALASASLATYITPEQIKDDLERFCSDPEILTAFYAETQAALLAAAAAQHPDHQGSDTPQPSAEVEREGSSDVGATLAPESAQQVPTGVKERDVGPFSPTPQQTQQQQRKRGSIAPTGSSLLRPVMESESDSDVEDLRLGGGGGGVLGKIPEMRLPESLHGTSGAIGRFWGAVGKEKEKESGNGSGKKGGWEGRVGCICTTILGDGVDKCSIRIKLDHWNIVASHVCLWKGTLGWYFFNNHLIQQ